MSRPQFSLKTMLWLTVVIAAFCAGTQLDRYLKDRADPSETSIRKALNERTDFHFVEEPFAWVIDYFKFKHSIEIQLDYKALIDAGVGIDTPVTRSIRGITLRSALKLLLDELNLTYVIKNGVLMITSKSEAPSTLFDPKTAMWLSVAVAVLLGTILFGRAWGRRSAVPEK